MFAVHSKFLSRQTCLNTSKFCCRNLNTSIRLQNLNFDPNMDGYGYSILAFGKVMVQFGFQTPIFVLMRCRRLKILQAFETFVYI